MRLSRAVLVLALVASSLLATGVAQAQSAPAPTFPGADRLGTAQDFAESEFADAWDYSNPSDLILDRGPTANVSNQGFADGHLKFDASRSAYVSLVFPGYFGALPVGREGQKVPLDARYYTHAAVRLYVGGNSNMGGALFWDRCYRSYSDVCRGEHQWVLRPGWNTYVLPLRQLTAGQQYGWDGKLSALRLAVGPSAPTTFAVDWVRVYRPSTPDVRVSWTNPSPGSTATVYWDNDTNPGNNTRQNGGWGVLGSSRDSSGTATFPASAYPGGTYYFYTEADGRYSAPSRPLTLVPRPRVQILDPDEAGGQDYATARRGDPWDFNQRSDVDSWGNATNVAFSGGAMHANNGGPTINDPFVWLKLAGGGIDSSRYHRMTIDFGYDGAFGLEDRPGGGTHGRVVWFRNGDHRTALETKEIVTYSGRRTYTFDLSTNPPSAVMETDRPHRVGWPGATVTGLRWDPNEDRGARRWRIYDVRLRADDQTSGNAFTIRWRDLAHKPGTTVSLYYDTNTTGGDGKLIARNIPQTAGVNTYRWWTGDVPPGTYYVYAIADDGTSTHRPYASGPLRVVRSSAPSPFPQWASWNRLAGGPVSPPAAVSWAHNASDVFTVDGDGDLRHRWHRSGSGWGPGGGWRDLGHPRSVRLVGQPGVVSQREGSLDVFARGSDDALWHRAYRPGSGWSGWFNRGGVLGSAPDAISWKNGHVAIFVTSKNNEVWERSYNGRWYPWRRVGGPVTSAPGVTAWSNGRIDVFARGTDGTLQHKYYADRAWGPWASRGGQLLGAGRPGAVSWGPGRLDVFVVGGAGLYRTGYQTGWRWIPSSGYESLGGPGPTVVSGTDASSRRAGHIEAYASTADGAVWYRTTR